MNMEFFSFFFFFYRVVGFSPVFTKEFLRDSTWSIQGHKGRKGIKIRGILRLENRNDLTPSR